MSTLTDTIARMRIELKESEERLAEFSRLESLLVTCDGRGKEEKLAAFVQLFCDLTAALAREKALREELQRVNGILSLYRGEAATPTAEDVTWAADRAKEHQAEQAELRKDGARLDWLDAHTETMVSTNEEGADLFGHNAYLNPEAAGQLRAAIDRAMGREESK